MWKFIDSIFIKIDEEINEVLKSMNNWEWYLCKISVGIFLYINQ
jgi:hypothetical protein